MANEVLPRARETDGLWSLPGGDAAYRMLAIARRRGHTGDLLPARPRYVVGRRGKTRLACRHAPATDYFPFPPPGSAPAPLPPLPPGPGAVSVFVFSA